MRLWNAVRKGDIPAAQEAQREVSIITNRLSPWLVEQKKVALRFRGIDVGDVRLPLLPPTAEETEEIHATLVEHGIIPGDDERWLRI